MCCLFINICVFLFLNLVVCDYGVNTIQILAGQSAFFTSALPVSAAAPDAAPAIDVEDELLRMASITDVLHEPEGYWDDN